MTATPNHMNIYPIILLSAVTSFAFVACKQPAETPPAGFRLTLQEVATDTDARAALVILRSASAGSISVDASGEHSSIVLGEPAASGFRDGSVALIATRIAPAGEGDIYIKTLIQPQTPNGGYAGGPSTYTLPRLTQLAAFFTITAKSGDYPLNTPIEIARLSGKPVTLTVGKPTK